MNPQQDPGSIVRAYRALFESNPDAIFALDSRPAFTSANPAAVRLSGYAVEELLRHSPAALIVPQDQERLVRRFEEVLSGTTVSDQVAITHKDGRRVDLSLTLVPILDGDAITGAYGIAQDITERLRAEAERDELYARAQEAQARATAAEQRAAFLARAGELLSASLEHETTLRNLADLIVPEMADWCAIDIAEPGDGGIQRIVGTADPALRESMRPFEQQVRSLSTDQEMIGRLTRFIRSGRPLFVPNMTEDMLVAAAGEQHAETLRHMGMTSFMRLPLRTRGSVAGAISFTYAGSGRHYTAADFALAEDLARRAAVAIDNARLFQEGQRAVQLRDDFLATASHDLKTPITAIKAYAQILHQRASRSRARGMVDLLGPLKAIDDSASRITGQINELVDLSRLHAGKPLVLNRSRLNLREMVERLMDTYRETSRQHETMLEAGDDDLTGYWDPVRLERVLNNVLSNAVKYSPAGGTITVSLRRDHGEGGPRAVIAVSDQGIGIPAADLPRIFQRFYRARNASASAPGTGIGLAGARDIVVQHGGSIEIDSREGEGTVITILLPVGAPDASFEADEQTYD